MPARLRRFARVAGLTREGVLRFLVSGISGAVLPFACVSTRWTSFLPAVHLSDQEQEAYESAPSQTYKRAPLPVPPVSVCVQSQLRPQMAHSTLTGERPFFCIHSSESFSSKSHLSKHMRKHNHTEERPFSCLYCHACFPQRRTKRPYVSSSCKETLKVKGIPRQFLFGSKGEGSLID
ncbi:zinc finger protein 776 isoform X2 [Rhipicephalus sanguineus]|uniref:zinc finger protein 776 isoform X2 n=1 Tax=Rhipicephalus sanguineus TaxID=34632 RepID=UPI0020C4F0EB|nr:zinc finger protein 776 isoform X2 [Rhipicephalus sanguineus]